MPKLFNRGQRTFNPNTSYVIKPNSWSPELTEEQAAKLLKMFPRELTSDEGVAQKHNLRIAELEQELAKTQAENKQLKDQVAGLQKILEADPLSANLLSNTVPTPAPVATPHAPETPAPATPVSTGKATATGKKSR